MDGQEQRKRAFSQAFQRMNQPRHSDQNAQPAKRILPYPLGTPGIHYQDFDQENEAPLDLDSTVAFEETPGTQVRYPAPVDLQCADPSLYNYASLQYELYGNGPGPEVEYELGSRPSPLFRERQPKFPARLDSLPTPPVVRGQPMFGSSPYVRPELDSLLGDTIDSYARPGPELSPMSDASTAVGPLTPSALHFGDLTLNSEGYSIPSSPHRHGDLDSRATVRIMPVASFARYACRTSWDQFH